MKRRGAELSVKALAAAQRTTGSGISAFGYGEIFAIIRSVAQAHIDAGNRVRAVRIVEDEILRAVDNPELEKMLRELLPLIKNGNNSNINGRGN